ncbi:MAG: NnrS family protein [Pseudomonadota bacterium]
MTALFNYGFRPFFLLAGVQAVAVMAVWLAVLHGMSWEMAWLAPVQWHAHEMIFGFVAAALAGFLLTAVASWTGQRGYAGPPLMVLVAVWLGGRIVMIPGLGVPQSLAAAIDLAFLPTVAMAVAPSLIRAGNVRNFPLLAFLVLLFAANLLFHAPDLAAWLGIRGPTLAVDTIMLMVVLVGGRIVPAFTGNALRTRHPGARVAPFGWVDRAAIAAAAAVLVVDLVTPGGRLAGVVALVACALHAWRLSRWRGWLTLDMPLAWVLHVAYAWIPMGLGLKALWLLWQLEAGAGWLHALTAGAYPTMILAVMTRAALGHTGRPLVAAKPIVIAYLLVTLAAITRVFAPMIAPATPEIIWTVAGTLWIAAFLLYCAVYAPILLRPRIDGRPG